MAAFWLAAYEMSGTIPPMTYENFQAPEGFSEQSSSRDWFDAYLNSREGKSRGMARKFRRKCNKLDFLDRPRKIRRSMVVGLGWKIRTDPNGQGIFFTRGILPGSRDWPVEAGQVPVHAWADFLFLSSRPKRDGIFYQAYALTAWEKAAQAIEELAQKNVEALLTDEERNQPRSRSFWKNNSDGSVSLVFSPEKTYESLGGLTKQGAQAKWLRENWDNLLELVKVNSEVKIDKEFSYGVGLDFVVDKITVDSFTIPEIISEFIERGEEAYCDPVDLAKYRDVLEKRMRASLWRWDYAQANSEDREMEQPDEDLRDFFDTHSNAIRM